MLRNTLLATLTFAVVAGSSSVAWASGDEAARLQRALDDLAVMEALLSGTLNEPAQRELLTKLSSVRLEVRGVQQDLLRSGGDASLSIDGPGAAMVAVTVTEGVGADVSTVLVTPAVLAEPVRLTRAPLDQLKAAIDSESFGDGKVAVLSASAAGNWFTTDQVIELLPLFAFSDDRVDAAVVLYPKVLDPENWFRVYGAFDFDGDKDEVRSRLGL
jgi:hypothetical protein